MTFKNLAAALLLCAFAALSLLAGSNEARAGAVLCQPQAAGTGPGAGTVGGTGSQVPSGTLYILNSLGCAAISNQDVGYFRSQGWFSGPNLFSVSIVGLTANSTAANSPILPAGAVIQSIVIQETAGQIVTGGLDIGTAAAGAQVVAAVACGASCWKAIPAASILLFTFPATGTPVQQSLFFTAHTNWTDGATVNATIFYSLVLPF